MNRTFWITCASYFLIFAVGSWFVLSYYMTVVYAVPFHDSLWISVRVVMGAAFYKKLMALAVLLALAYLATGYSLTGKL